MELKLFTAAVILLLFFFIAGVVWSLRIRKKKQMEILDAVIDMQENERKRIAEDLHDEIGPMLSAIKLKLNTIKTGEDFSEIPKVIDEINIHLDHTIQNIRETIRNLSPTNLKRNGLIKCIEEFRALLEANKAVEFEFRHEGMDQRLKESAEISIYRILMEMIHNSVRHSNCSVIQLMIKMYARQMMILYTDNGTVLFRESAGMGMGLKNIYHRTQTLQGKLITREAGEPGLFYQIILNKSTLVS